jgi:hypothetical protein
MKHLEILKKGVAAWNAWRQANPEIRPDLQNANLQNADLHGANLSGANLQNADLRGANLQDADLRGANLQDTKIWYVSLEEAKFSEDTQGVRFFLKNPPIEVSVEEWNTKKSVQRIKDKIEEYGSPPTFWQSFDRYDAVVGTDAWENAVEKLPEEIRQVVYQRGLDGSLDREFFNSPGNWNDEFLKFVDAAIFMAVQSDPNLADWKEALRLVYTVEP